MNFVMGLATEPAKITLAGAVRQWDPNPVVSFAAAHSSSVRVVSIPGSKWQVVRRHATFAFSVGFLIESEAYLLPRFAPSYQTYPVWRRRIAYFLNFWLRIWGR